MTQSCWCGDGLCRSACPPAPAEFDIHPETSKARGLPDLFEVDCLGEAYLCSATWSLPPGERATVMVTVHGGNPLDPSSGPQGFRVFA